MCGSGAVVYCVPFVKLNGSASVYSYAVAGLTVFVGHGEYGVLREVVQFRRGLNGVVDACDELSYKRAAEVALRCRLEVCFLFTW